MRERMWSDQTWEDILSNLAACGRAANLPVGAKAEHGPHLGCGTASVLVDALVWEVSKRVPILALPTVPRLFVVNSRVTNAAPLRCAFQMLRAAHDDRMIAVVNTPHVSECVGHAHFQDPQDWHADRAVMSLMHTIAPWIVRENKIADADDEDRTRGLVFANPVNRTSVNGVTGKPSAATKEGGGTPFCWMVEDLADVVARGCLETPTLANSFFRNCKPSILRGASS
jgi:creatinine amidohydrolase